MVISVQNPREEEAKHTVKHLFDLFYRLLLCIRYMRRASYNFRLVFIVSGYIFFLRSYLNSMLAVTGKSQKA